MAWVTAFAASQCGNRMYRMKAGGRTFQTRITLPFGGEKLRLTLASMYGTRLNIGAMSVTAHGQTMAVSVDQKKTFAVEKDQRLLTDEISLSVEDGEEIEIRTYFSKGFFQSGLWQETEISIPGDYTERDFVLSKDDLWASKKRPLDIGIPFPAVAGIDVLNPAKDAKAVAILGASNEFLGRWVKPLRESLASFAPHTALLDLSISGNRLLKDTGNQILLGNLFGYRATKRFKDEILGFSGIQNVILCIGANDILHPHTFACYPWEQEPSFKELTAALEEMICLSHSEGIKVIGTTITPLKCADGFSEKKRLLRKEVNAWMKAFTGYDAVFDLSSVIQSPEDSDMMNKVYNSGDFLHFNAEGGQAIADAFPREYLKP